MLKFLFLVSFLLISDITKVSSLQCYSCQNCNTVNADTAVETCGVTTTTTPGSTTTPTGESTTTPAGGSTTTPGGGSTTPPSGGSSTTQTSSSSTQTTSSSTTSTTTVASSTLPPEYSSSVSPGVSIDANNPDPDSPIESIDGNSRVNSRDFEVIRARREVSRAESNGTVDYVCVIVTHKENGTDQQWRGCSPKSGDNDVCTLLQSANANVTCSSCNTDKCNSATSLQMSLFLLLIVTFARFALFK